MYLSFQKTTRGRTALLFSPLIPITTCILVHKEAIREEKMLSTKKKKKKKRGGEGKEGGKGKKKSK